ncbi:ABC transporter ATP-binding protein [Cohnella lupini]|uniref:Energy-coupling factor transport system ATP-binding protein n=1 Tax=Cohnella lupini TaxID=1294267 RepID=A0A3D9I8P9_9BACL|nr:ATP-binding cassette domain-containing protein [Cohnella lupini]RED58025.1 energy-coupling factor transport system ATP-binding protein [Cohnella lupini]
MSDIRLSPGSVNPQAAVEILGATFRYPGADRASLDGMDFRVERGGFTAVIGSNGSGKSSLCKALTGLIPHYYSGDLEGSVKVAGVETQSSSVSQLAYRIGYVCQDFENQLVRPTVWEETIFAPMNFGHADYEERATRILERLGIFHLKDRFIWQLSGGQKHITAIAAALSLEPDIIIVDEPAAELDPFHAESIYALLKQLNEREGKTIIVIEHHTEWVAKYCRDVVLLSGGKTVWHKPVAEALSNVEELQAHQIYPPQVTQIAHSLDVGRLEERYPITLEEGITYLRNVGVRAPTNNAEMPASPASEGEVLMRYDNVGYVYPTLDKKGHCVFDKLSLSIRAGDRVAIVGGNGAGKTTLLRMMTGLVKPQQGELSLAGKPLRKMSPEQTAGQVSYVYQKPENMFICDNIRDDIAYFQKARRTDIAEKLTEQLMSRLHLNELKDRDGRLLSGGQQRRASLAIGLSMRPKLLLLDEPTASLDVVSRKETIGMLEKIGDTIEAVVVATHDMQLVAEWANRVLVMHHGKLVADVSPSELFSNEAGWSSWGLMAPQVVELSLGLGWKQAALSPERFLEQARSNRTEIAEVNQVVSY